MLTIVSVPFLLLTMVAAVVGLGEILLAPLVIVAAVLSALL